MFLKIKLLLINYTQPKEEKMEYESKGLLQIGTYTAQNALPVENISVRISGREEGNGGIDYTVITDRDGLTEIVELPTPSVSFSLAPNSPEQAFSKYNIEASGEGYYTKSIYDVAIFSGVKSFLPLEMIPNAGLIKNVSPPTSSNSSIITENEDLQ